MATAGTVDAPRTQNDEFEPVPLLIFPEKLFLSQFGVGVSIAPLRTSLERSLFVHPRATSESGDSIYTERADQDYAYRPISCDRLQQISGSYYRIKKKIGRSALHAGSNMENDLHGPHGTGRIVSVLQISDAILKTGVRILSR